MLKSGNSHWDNYYVKVQQFIEYKHINKRDIDLTKFACLIASKNFELIKCNSDDFKEIFSDSEIIEITWQISFYTGISIVNPIAIIFSIDNFTPYSNGNKTPTESWNIGNEFIQAHEIFRHGGLREPELSVFPDITLALSNYLKIFLYGEAYNEKKRDKAIVLIATLTALSHAEEQFSVHIKTSINLGLKKDEIPELLLCCLGLIDFPTVARKIKLANDYFKNQAE